MSNGNKMTPSQHREAGLDAWQSLKAPDWKAFSFATGHVLLHVPSAHVLEVPEDLAAHVRGERQSPELQAELDELAASLPLPVVKAVTPDIQAVSLNMAQGCNLRCTYCFAGEGDYGQKAMMSYETAVRVLEFFSNGKERFHVVFFGGEPLLNYAVIQPLVAWCERQPCRFSFAMTTNATLLTPEKLAWLKAKNVALTISYDGHGIQARQRLNKDRQSNSEALVERKLAAFKEQLANLQNFKLRATVMRQNLDLLEDALVTTINAQNVRLMISMHSTAANGMRFTDEDIDRLGEILERVVDRYLAARDFDRLLKLENIRLGVQKIHHGYTGARSCGAGLTYLTVSAAGRYYLCHRFNEDESESFGSIEEGLNQERLAEVGRFRGAGAEPCSTCWMRQWCAGGCFHDHKAATGNIFDLDPLFCKLQDLELRQAMRVHAVLRTEAPHLLAT